MIRLGAICLLWPAATAAQETLVIATGGDNRPYIYLTPENQLTGLDQDLLNELCARLSVDCTWEVVPFRELLPGVQSGRFDMAVGGIGTSAQRDEFVDFTCWYDWDDTDSAAFVGLRENLDPGRDVIGVLDGSLDADTLERRGYQAQPFDTKVELLEALLASDIDLYFGFEFYIATSPLMEGTPIVTYETLILDRTGAAIVVAENRQELRIQLDQHLADMSLDGTLDRLRFEWLGLTSQPLECRQTNLHS